MKNVNEKKIPHSVKFLRQRKFFLVLPVIVLPFTILLLWTLGIVGSAKGETQAEKKWQGLNLNLPTAAPSKDSNWNKLKYYEQADKDSAVLKALVKKDPFRRGELEALTNIQDTPAGNRRHYAYNPYPPEKEQDPNERRVYGKLAKLNQQLEQANDHEKYVQQQREPAKKPAAIISTDVDRLEKMMHSMNQPKGEDEEMKQYNDMLEKILDIQNPERAQAKIRQQSQEHKQQVFSVETPAEDIISMLEAKPGFKDQLRRYQSDSIPRALQVFMESNRFYSLEEPVVPSPAQHCISAVVHEDQTLISGASIKMRLLQDIYIAGMRIPKDEFVHGTATLKAERLVVVVTSIEYQNQVLPVALSVYDKTDGLAGIKIPGAITREVAKQSAVQSLQGLGAANTLDPSIGAQAVTAGIQAAQNLVTKSIKLIKVTVGAGHAVLLKDDNKKND